MNPTRAVTNFKRWPYVAISVALSSLIIAYLIVGWAHSVWSPHDILRKADPSFFTAWQAAGIVMGIAGFIHKVYSDKRANYSDANSRYRDFSMLLLQHETTGHLMGFPAAEIERFTNAHGDKKTLIVYDLLFSLCEYAYALYGSRPDDWERWEKWLKNFFDNDPLAFVAWDIVSAYFEKPFVKRVEKHLLLDRKAKKFPSREEWRDATEENHKLTIKCDSSGKHESLIIHGFQVMQAWELPLMKAMADAIEENCSSVLEVGFGLGFLSHEIQAKTPKMHTILEPNTYLAGLAKDNFRKEVAAGKVKIIEAYWNNEKDEASDICQHWIDCGDKFRAIAFDGFPLSPTEVRRNHFPFFEVAAKLLDEGGTFTFFSDHAQYLSPSTQTQLYTWFPNAKLTLKRINVFPPESCEYWTSPHILHVELRSS